MTADRKSELEAFSLQIQAIGYERNEEIVSGESDRSKAQESRKNMPKNR